MIIAENERPRGLPRGIQERNPQEHTQQAAGYSSSRERGINQPFYVTTQPYHNSCLLKEFVTPAKAGVHKNKVDSRFRGNDG
jgi:hypothetical protein